MKDYQHLHDDLAEASQQASIQPRISPAAKQVLSNLDFAATYYAMPKAKKRELWQILIDSIELGERPKKAGRSYSSFKVKFC